MLIAREKYKKNVAEYILYMFQVEDTIRACQFDIDLIEERVIKQFSVADKVKQDIRDWYADLIVQMHQEKIRASGHLSSIQKLIDELYALHVKLVKTKTDTKYMEIYYRAAQNIKEFEHKLDKPPANEIESCFIALYALLLLKLSRKEISAETLEAMHTFSNLLAILSQRFKDINAL